MICRSQMISRSVMMVFWSELHVVKDRKRVTLGVKKQRDAFGKQ
jgi:hypothetical protein